MTKTDLIDTLHKKTGFSKSKSTQVVELFFDEMSNALAVGERVGNQGLLHHLCQEL
jgi:nucleoid DNA-binding protein